MKTIGLIGGTSWPSTMLYYQYMQEVIAAQSRGSHSAHILMNSIDYPKVRENYTVDWPYVRSQLNIAIKRLMLIKPDCLVLANNTLHKALHELQYDHPLSIPVFDALILTAQSIKFHSYQRVLFLGTRMTMEDNYYRDYLSLHSGACVFSPTAKDRNKIQVIQTQLAQGLFKPSHAQDMNDVISRYKSFADVVVLACTELPIALKAHQSCLPIINPTDLQCQAAAQFSLAGNTPLPKPSQTAFDILKPSR